MAGFASPISTTCRGRIFDKDVVKLVIDRLMNLYGGKTRKSLYLNPIQKRGIYVLLLWFSKVSSRGPGAGVGYQSERLL